MRHPFIGFASVTFTMFLVTIVSRAQVPQPWAGGGG